MRWFYVIICAAFGLALLVCGLLLPMHLRALDANVIASAGRTGPALLDQGQSLANQGKLGAAQMLMEAAQLARIPGGDQLGESITNLAQRNPAELAWGRDSQVENIFGHSAKPDQSFTSYIVVEANRTAVLHHLRASKVPAVVQLLKTCSLQNTVIFPPSRSASGQAFDTAVCVCGLLLEGNDLTPKLSGEIEDETAQADRGGSTQPIEEVLMDFLSLGQRFNWDQLKSFVANISDADTLDKLTEGVRESGNNLPVLFAAVQLSGAPAEVADYLAGFPATGLKDFQACLPQGGGGIKELVKSQKRYFRPNLEGRAAAYLPIGGFVNAAAALSLQVPWLVLTCKLFCYIFAGFLLAEAASSIRPMQHATPLDGFFLERTLRTGNVPRERPSAAFHFLRVFLFSLAFLFVVLLLSEPFLAQSIQKGGLSFHLLLPTVGRTVFKGIAGFKQTIMNPTIILTLFIFFVLQSLIFMSCLVKLAEIQRQKVPPRIKLRLLENEDHLFDAGLYLGFVGTIVSLIIASLGLVQFSLMAAYSSTSFGIIFVVVFKIFYLRPARRKLLLQSEVQSAAAPPSGAATQSKPEIKPDIKPGSLGAPATA